MELDSASEAEEGCMHRRERDAASVGSCPCSHIAGG